MSTPSVPNGHPWYVRLFSDSAALANVVAFGAALLLLYTAGWEWPRQAERFHDRMQEQRDMVREVSQLQRENQRILLRIELAQQQQLTLMQGLQKVLTEMWFRMKQAEKKADDEPVDPFTCRPIGEL